MIFMNDFRAEPQALKDEMLTAAARVVESGWFVLGNEVDTFQSSWAEACGVAHAIGLGNGMDAIEIALRSLSIGSGDEVITTPMTAFATVLAIFRAGATPVLADVNMETGLLNHESVVRCISSKTKAVVLVHLYGHMRDMDEWVQLCKAHGIHLIEDCAQCHLAVWQGQVAGSFGAAGAYSFYPTKNLGALGDGGMLVTNDTVIAERASRIGNYGQRERYYHSELGMNSRLDEIQAAILKVRLKWLPEFTRRRRMIASAYMHGINNKYVEQMASPHVASEHVYHLYVIKCDMRDALRDHLKNCGVQTLCHYPVPVHHQEACKNIRRDPNGLKNSERHSNTCLSLPCHPQMDDAQVATVIDAVNSFKA